MKNIDAATNTQAIAPNNSGSYTSSSNGSQIVNQTTSQAINQSTGQIADRRDQMRSYHLRESLQYAENQILHPTLGKDRLIALTDAILAIIMTVLVLELPKPTIRDWGSIW